LILPSVFEKKTVAKNWLKKTSQMGRKNMAKIIIVGSGAVATVGVQKCAQNHQVFQEIVVASRHKEKVMELVEKCSKYPTKVIAEQVDAENIDAMVKLIEKYHPDLVMNLALPYTNIPIMEACIATHTHYMDTACAEVREKAGFEYGTQWVYHERFKKAGCMALLGSGFDPGVPACFACMEKSIISTRSTLLIFLTPTEAITGILLPPILIPKSTFAKSR